MVLAYLSAPIIRKGLRKDDFCSIVLEVLEDMGVTVFAPQLLEPVDSETIFKRDVDQVRKSDFLIAEVTSPSLGVGMEIMLSIELMKPVLLFLHSDAERLSKMVSGADGKALFNYNTPHDVEKILRSINFDNLLVLKCPVCPSHVAEVNAEEIRCIQCGHIEREVLR